MIIKEAFELGETVYLKTDTEQLPHVVTGYVIRPGGTIIYKLSCCGEETNHYDLEITKEQDTLLKVTS